MFKHRIVLRNSEVAASITVPRLRPVRLARHLWNGLKVRVAELEFEGSSTQWPLSSPRLDRHLSLLLSAGLLGSGLVCLHLRWLDALFDQLELREELGVDGRLLRSL